MVYKPYTRQPRPIIPLCPPQCQSRLPNTSSSPTLPPPRCLPSSGLSSRTTSSTRTSCTPSQRPSSNANPTEMPHRFPLAHLLDDPQLRHRPNPRFRPLRHPWAPGRIPCFHLYPAARSISSARLHSSSDAADGRNPMCIRSSRTRLLRLCSRSDHPRVRRGLDPSDWHRAGYRPRVLLR
jgi:hypothetical protein